MKGNLPLALSIVLEHEGGYVNNPKDPGGETNYGITRSTARAHGYTGNMRAIPMQTVRRIYEQSYWSAVRGDELPTGVDLAVFDFAVNSGPTRSIQFLQTILGVRTDGRIGPVTLNAVNAFDPFRICSQLCDNRLTWLATLKTWPHFKNGWTRRVLDIKKRSLEWVLNP
jgi:lysozyme family protein